MCSKTFSAADRYGGFVLAIQCAVRTAASESRPFRERGLKLMPFGR